MEMEGEQDGLKDIKQFLNTLFLTQLLYPLFLSVIHGEWERDLVEGDAHACVCGAWGWTAALHVWGDQAGCSHPNLLNIYSR